MARPRRESTGKRTRFEVFKRDHFASIENLITACETCNQGKSDRDLSLKQIRPDADLLWLETQQEIAELRRYQDAKAERDEILAEIVADLQEVWCEFSGVSWHPSDRIMHELLARYSPEVVEYAIKDVAAKVGSGFVQTYGDRWLRYLHGVLRNAAAES